MPLRIVDYRTITCAMNLTACPAAILQRVHASPNQIWFSKRLAYYYDNSDVAPYLNTDYLLGCSPDLFDIVQPIILPDGEIAVYFFLPSLEELHLNPHNDPDLEQHTWEHYRHTTTIAHKNCEERTFLSPEGVAQDCLLRSTEPDDPELVWRIGPNGDAYYNVVSKPAAYSAACAIY